MNTLGVLAIEIKIETLFIFLNWICCNSPSNVLLMGNCNKWRRKKGDKSQPEDISMKIEVQASMSHSYSYFGQFHALFKIV